MSKEKDPQLEIYGQKAYDLYDKLKKIAPGFKEGLDHSTLATYVSLLCMQKEIRGKIKEAKQNNNQEKVKVLKQIIQDYKPIIRNMASSLGFTPESRLKIEKHLKKKKQ